MNPVYELPRTALLSWCTPDSRYAGGEAMRRLLSRMPADQIRWCGLNPCMHEPLAWLPEYRAFVPQGLHWRLEGTSLHHFFANDLQARRLAGEMWAWLKPFNPEVIWVIPEVAAVPVARELHRLSGVPIHATLHDSPDTAGLAGLPRLYARHYQKQARRLMESTASIDAVADSLIRHMATEYNAAHCEGVVVRPAVDPAFVHPVIPRAWSGAVRRIGLCGSFRIDEPQWAAFTRALGRLPYRVEIVSFTPPDEFPRGTYPDNISLHFEPYAKGHDELILAFRSAQIDAGYLGVWNDTKRAIFGQTSLSSKLTSYAACGVPVIVHSREDAAVWDLVRPFGAGVRFDENSPGGGTLLEDLFSNPDTWFNLAQGAHALARESLNLDANAEILARALCKAAAGAQDTEQVE